MDLTTLRLKIVDFIKKYKYVVVILVVGLVLMLLPSGSSKKSTTQTQAAQLSNSETINEELAEILSKIKGAGKVQVFLTVASGEETVYQTDENISNSDTGSTVRRDTVTVTDGDRNQTGLIKQVIPAVYQGAIIVCDGADSAAVRLAIVEAVSKVTGLGYDHISVLKMK